MNRHERRKAKAIAKRATLSPVVAIHEAGHAVGRIVTAKELGHSLEDAIAYIEIAPPVELGKSVDKKMSLTSQAVTMGPMFSAPLTAIQTAVMAEMGFVREIPGSAVNDFYRQVMRRAQPADVETWLNARALDCVMGATAEAIFTGGNFYKVWNGYECETDAGDVVKFCMMAAMARGNDRASDDEILAIEDRAIGRGRELIKRVEIRQAIQAVANILPAAGRVDGSKIIAAATTIAGVV